MMLKYSLILLVLMPITKCKEFATLNHLVTKVAATSQEDAVRGLIHRLMPDSADRFVVHVDSSIGPKYRDTFELRTVDTRMQITGTSGVAVASGFYYYLSQYCNCHVSWAGAQIHLPDLLPIISEPKIVTSNDRFHYYQNTCTQSYSFAWWDWSRWEQEIDWMALYGINLPLAFDGQEAIWQRVYKSMGFTDDDLNDHFGGPGFLAWARMGNMRGWGGPLSQNWHDQQVALQHKILDRMRSFGMIPVLPAFAGHVPYAITRLFPNVSVSKMPDWGRFSPKYCCTLLLDVEDPMFVKIGKAFITEYIKEFGTDHIYNTDTFNEMQPKSSDPAYLDKAGKAVYNGMTTGDPDAIWLMMAWLFKNEAFWKTAQAKALLTSVPQGKMILLDTFAEVNPQYLRMSSYFGQPFIWCMLHNFGGTMALYGTVERVNNGPFDARAFTNSTMIGIGMDPEGINQNNVMYEFMIENKWRTKPRDISVWMSNYAARRYGEPDTNADNAWQAFKQTVYNCTDGKKHHNKNLFVRRPSKRSKIDAGVYNSSDDQEDHSSGVPIVKRPNVSPPLNQDIWYDPNVFFKGWDSLLAASGHLGPSDLYRYDLVDVSRQALQIISTLLYDGIIDGYKSKNISSMIESGKHMLDLLADLDTLLSSDHHFLLGNWLDSAKSLAMNADEKALYEMNARNQITSWGPNHNINDYANKQWSGLVRDYYRPRWEMFIMDLTRAMLNNKPFDQGKYNKDVFKEIEMPFSYAKNIYNTTASNDQVVMAKMIHSKYRPLTKSHSYYFSMLPKWSKKRHNLTKHRPQWMVKTHG